MTKHSKFIEQLHNWVYNENLVIFTTSGRQIRLPAKSKIKDFIGKLKKSSHVKYTVKVNRNIKPYNYFFTGW